MENSYDAIKVLSSVEHVQKRPHMYISSDIPSFQMVDEILSNAVDEAMNNYADCIKLDIDYNTSTISISDNGRGLPHNFNRDFDKYDVELIYTYLNAGGKFDQSNYEFSGGLHGAGSCVVNALSSYLNVVTWRGNKIVEAHFIKGITKDITSREDSTFKGSGTKVSYMINEDMSVFSDRLSDYEQDIVNKINLLKTLMPDVHIWYNGEEIDSRDFREFLQLSKEPLLKDSILLKSKNYYLALNWSKDTNKMTQVAYCNSIFNPHGGDHINAIYTALSEIFGADVWYGINVAVSINYPGVEYDSQTKTKAISKEMKAYFTEDLLSELKSYFRKNPQVKEDISNLVAYKRRELNKRNNKSNVKRDRKSTFLNTLGSISFADCNTKNREEAELYLVEGNSAAGSAKQARDVETQAIMPLRGKVLNVINADIASTLNNKEIATIFSNLDTGVFQDFNIRKSRYGKIIIFTDADEDGKNIAALLISLFMTLSPELIEEGYLYLALPPLYGVQDKDKFIPISDEETKNKYLKKGFHVTRYKGLGEMNPEQLRISCMAPDTRKLIKIDKSAECEEMVKNIMGSDTSFRRQLLIREGVLK